MANIVPDTESLNVAVLSIAWDIVRTTLVTGNTAGSGSAGAASLTNEVIKVYLALLQSKPIGN